MLQLWFLTGLCIGKWFNKFGLVLNDAPHAVHEYGPWKWKTMRIIHAIIFPPNLLSCEWTSWCRRRSCLCLKHLPHFEQTNRNWLCSEFLWYKTELGFLKNRLHLSHGYLGVSSESSVVLLVSVSSWMSWKCTERRDSFANVLLHIEQSCLFWKWNNSEIKLLTVPSLGYIFFQNLSELSLTTRTAKNSIVYHTDVSEYAKVSGPQIQY